MPAEGFKQTTKLITFDSSPGADRDDEVLYGTPSKGPTSADETLTSNTSTSQSDSAAGQTSYVH